MPSASREAGQPSRLHPRTAPRPLVELPPANLPGRSRVVIRLPALTSAGAAPLIEAAASSAAPDSLIAPLAEPVASETFDWAPANDSFPVDLPAALDMTTFAIPHSSADETLAPEIDSTPTSLASDAPPPKPATSAAQASRAEHNEVAITPAAGARNAAAGGGLSAAWRLVRQGHAFVMQPKVWLACVLACFAVLLGAFVSAPSAEPPDSPNSAAAETPAKAAPEPTADVAVKGTRL